MLRMWWALEASVVSDRHMQEWAKCIDWSYIITEVLPTDKYDNSNIGFTDSLLVLTSSLCCQDKALHVSAIVFALLAVFQLLFLNLTQAARALLISSGAHYSIWVITWSLPRTIRQPSLNNECHCFRWVSSSLAVWILENNSAEMRLLRGWQADIETWEVQVDSCHKTLLLNSHT